nr:MAG: RNA-dependent RNA-polymerase [Picobirnavirus sp.]
MKNFHVEKLPSDFQAVITENNGLTQYLTNLQRGRDFTPRSWLFESENPTKVLNRWKQVLNSLKDGNAFEKEVFHFDISSEEKWGPQGGIAPIKELMNDVVLPTFQGDTEGFTSFRGFQASDWKTAKRYVKAQLTGQDGASGLRPASYPRVIDDMRARDTLESNSGWPMFTRRNKPEVRARAIADAENGSWSTQPAIALFRNYRQKTRMVWMFPMAANLVEGSFTQPLQSRIINSGDTFYSPWVGFEAVRKLITEMYANGKVIAASDFSSTDAHFQYEATRQVFDVIKYCFQKKYCTTLEQSLKYMNFINLVISRSEWIVGGHGVSSGSNWTNFIETVFDEIFGHYVSQQTKYHPFYAIGDDMAWWCSEADYDEGFNQQLEKLGKTIGQVIKAEKTTNDRDKVKSLQRLFQRGYKRPDGLIRGVYPTIRALNSLIYPERFHNPKDWSSDMFCARVYMILENCVDHPLFEEFVKFVVKGQKDLIPFAKQSDRRLNQIQRKSKLLPGLNPTYNAEKRDSSLASFASIAIAKTC